MDWLVQRYVSTLNLGGTSQGLLFEKTDSSPLWFCHTLEDESRPDKKMMHETRMRAGLRELIILKEDTELTVKHREVYNKGFESPWFTYHIMIVTPDFTGAYVHAGVKESHTDGCLLLMDTMGNSMIDIVPGARSLQAMKRFYERCYPFIDGGGRSWIEFRDEISLK